MNNKKAHIHDTASAIAYLSNGFRAARSIWPEGVFIAMAIATIEGEQYEKIVMMKPDGSICDFEPVQSDFLAHDWAVELPKQPEGSSCNGCDCVTNVCTCNDRKVKAFAAAAEPLIKYLAESGHEYRSAVVTSSHAELLDCVMDTGKYDRPKAQ